MPHEWPHRTWIDQSLHLLKDQITGSSLAIYATSNGRAWIWHRNDCEMQKPFYFFDIISLLIRMVRMLLILVSMWIVTEKPSHCTAGVTLAAPWSPWPRVFARPKSWPAYRYCHLHQELSCWGFFPKHILSHSHEKSKPTKLSKLSAKWPLAVHPLSINPLTFSLQWNPQNGILIHQRELD